MYLEDAAAEIFIRSKGCRRFRLGMSQMAQITKDTLIGDILKADPDSASFFMAIGMYCVACPASLGETLEQACMVHGVDADEITEKLNEQIASRDSAEHSEPEK